MIHHYLTFYVENDIRYAEAWIQIDIFGLCFCLWKIKKEIIPVSIVNAIRDEGIKIGAELAAMHGSDATTQELEKEYWHGYEDAMQRRDVKPVVHGKWVLKTFDDGYGEYQLYECNLCGAVTAQRKSKNYCHNCGAKMESEE